MIGSARWAERRADSIHHLSPSIRNRLAVRLLYEIYGLHYLAVQSMGVIGIIRRIDEAAEVTSMATADCATAFT
jgi:hypothetical protein